VENRREKVRQLAATNMGVSRDEYTGAYEQEEMGGPRCGLHESRNANFDAVEKDLDKPANE